jgi:thioester reductase-like protein
MKKDRDMIQDEIDIIWHLGGAGGITANRREALKFNWQATINMFKLAEGMKHLKRFNLLSSIIVSGNYRGVWREDMLDVKQQFIDEYARTKFLAEIEARRWGTFLPITVFRPGAVVGDSRSGYIPHVCGPYYMLKVLLKMEELGLRLPFPVSAFSKNSFMHMVPVDYVADSLAYIGKQESVEGKTYHLTDPNPLTCMEFLTAVCEETKIGKPRWAIPTRSMAERILTTPIISQAVRGLGKMVEMPLEILVYTQDVHYDTENTRSILKGLTCPRPKDYLPTMLDFARKELFPKEPLLPFLGERSPRLLRGNYRNN